MSESIQQKVIINALRERAQHETTDEDLANLLTSAADALSHQYAEAERPNVNANESNFFVSLSKSEPNSFWSQVQQWKK
jgi:hypothetical protein